MLDLRLLMLSASILVACGPGTRLGADATGDASVDGAALVCQPNTGTCEGAVSHACLPDGSAVVDVACDPVQGMSCDPTTGLCAGACAPQTLGQSYLGCDYYPTITANEVDNNFHFAVAIANSTTSFATVVIEGGGLTAPETFTVAPLAVEVRTLPWIEALKGCTSVGSITSCGPITTPAALARGGAYRIRTTQPVSVVQFSPLEFKVGDQSSNSNDASLLAPVTAMATRYLAIAWPAWDTHGIWPAPSPGLVAVTATADATAVTLTTTADTPAAGGAPAFVAGVAQTVTLQRGDVLQVTSSVGDLTGSMVTADHPVQVIAGHYCTDVPFGTGTCDHLEESMFPVDTLGRDYLIAAPAVPMLPDGKSEVVRIVATAPATTLTFDPPQAAPTVIADAGGIVELTTAASFRVTSDKRILVAQYMEGYDAGGLAGDPSMSLAVPTEQFRSQYVFHVPATYATNYVDVLAPLGKLVQLDGAPLAHGSPIGTSGYGVLRLAVASGNHVLMAEAPVGISVAGYAPTTSYWYPGGLDLRPIVIQ